MKRIDVRLLAWCLLLCIVSACFLACTQGQSPTETQETDTLEAESETVSALQTETDTDTQTDTETESASEPEPEAPKTEAIVILHGITGGRLVAAQDFEIPIKSGMRTVYVHVSEGDVVWDPLDRPLTQIMSCVRSLACDESGNPLYAVTCEAPIVSRDPDEKGLIVGTIDTYHALYASLYDAFHTERDVIFFTYDWRKDPYDSARDLDAFLTARGYSSVSFVTHSMGGLVAEQYLGIGQAQRDMTERVVEIATPLLGTTEMAGIFMDPHLSGNDTLDALASDLIRRIVINVPSMYTLFAAESGFTPYLSCTVGDMTVTCQTYRETMDAYATYLSGWNAELSALAEQKRMSMFGEDGVPISASVDAYYIVGTGAATAVAFEGISEAEGEPWTTFRTAYAWVGDDRVRLNSATANGLVDSNRVYLRTADGSGNLSHVGFVDATLGGERNGILPLVCDLLSGKAQGMTEEALQSAYDVTCLRAAQ